LIFFQLCATLDRLEAERLSAEVRAEDAIQQFTAVRQNLIVLQQELDLTKAQRDGLVAALTEWAEWRGNLARRLVQTLEVQRAWLATVDQTLLLDLDVGTVSCVDGHLHVTASEEVPRSAREGGGGDDTVTVIVRLESMAVAGKLVR
jgi:hypothetical protein